MPESAQTRVAVYIDFDNIIISRYHQLHGPNRFFRDSVRNYSLTHARADPEVNQRILAAMVDIGAILDYASSFGTIVLSRAYADWSALANSRYQTQLIARAVDLTQLFPTAGRTKNGADIRLAVDAVEDMFRLSDITHMVIVAGDSDYIALAQRAKRMGRYVVGIGVTGATSGSLAAACDEFIDYDALPGLAVTPSGPSTVPGGGVDVTPVDSHQISAEIEDSENSDLTPESSEQPAPGSNPLSSSPVVDTAMPTIETADTGPGATVVAPDGIDAQAAATDLLLRAMRLVRSKTDTEWLYAAEVKSQMRRMDPSFQELALGFRGFTDFVRARPLVAEWDKDSPYNARTLRLVEPAD